MIYGIVRSSKLSGQSLCAHDYLGRSPVVIQQEIDKATKIIECTQRRVQRLKNELEDVREKQGGLNEHATL